MKLLLYTPVFHRYEICLRSIETISIPSEIENLEIISDDRILGFKEPYDEITEKYKNAQHYFLAGKYDALLTIEDDLIIPSSTISNLLTTDADVVYSLYVSRKDGKWLAYKEVNESGGYSYSEFPSQLGNIKTESVDVEGVGLGCTLIYRHVLERISFQRRGTACCDWYFAVDCKKIGFRQKCNMKNTCGHFDGTKILYPTNIL